MGHVVTLLWGLEPSDTTIIQFWISWPHCNPTFFFGENSKLVSYSSTILFVFRREYVWRKTLQLVYIPLVDDEKPTLAAQQLHRRSSTSIAGKNLSPLPDGWCYSAETREGCNNWWTRSNYSSSKNVVLRHWTLIIGLSSTACSVLSLWLECYGSNFRAFWIRVSMSLPCKRVTWSSQQPSINPLKSHYDCFSHSWYSMIFLIPIWKFPEMGVPPSHPFYFRIFPSKPTGYWGIPNLGNPM